MEAKIAEMLTLGVPPRVATKSAICRSIIAEQLGIPKGSIIAGEVLNQSYSISRAICEQVLNQLMLGTETLVEAAIAQLGAD